MPAARPTPHIAWPLKVLAAAAVVGAVVAGVREARGGDPDDPGSIRREGSEEADGDAPVTDGPFPASSEITYRIVVPGSRTTEVSRMIAPFTARVESYAGTDATGAPTAEREVSFGRLATRSSGGNPVVLEVPPAVAGPRLAEALRSAEPLGLVDRREIRTVAGRRCQVWRTGSDLGATTFVDPSSSSYLDLCVDGQGLLLEEWQVEGGVAVRQKVAVRVSVGGVRQSEVGKLGTEVTLALSDGGGSVQRIGDTERPVGPFLELPAPPEGFTRQGRYSVVPPHPGLREGGDRRKVRAATVDVFVRGVDVVVVEHGGVLDLSDPWAVEARFPDVDLGPAVGTGELVPGRLGSEVRALLGSGRYLRLFGTVEIDRLLELARGLVAIDGGSGVRIED